MKIPSVSSLVVTFAAAASACGDAAGPMVLDGGSREEGQGDSATDGAAGAPGQVDAAADPPDGAGSCRPAFASGVNVAWIRFANDVPNPNITSFATVFRNTYDAGGRVVRWWFHTNGTVTPGYDAAGLARPISAAQIADVRRILDAAQATGVVLVISLWSFDMLQATAASVVAQNIALLTQDAPRQAYIDNVLTPMVTALRGHPGLYAWEIFNEAEGMTTQHGWSTNRVDERDVQICVNWFADAIRAADPGALVTNSAWTFRANSMVPRGGQNYYSDAALIAAGGRTGGILDFYEVHYYAMNGAALSPFVHPASYWNLDKPIVIGEFWALATDGVPMANLYTHLFDTGYAGAWAWQYQHNDVSGQETRWPAMEVPMKGLYDAQPAAASCR